MTPGVVYACRPADLPLGEHFVILRFGSITVPGDERSHTHPGHGYAEHTVPTVSCAVFPTREAWAAEIERLNRVQHGDKNWVSLIAHVPAVTTSVKVDIR